MMQAHQQLLSTSEEYNSLFSKNEFYPVQKAYTTPHFLVMSIRFPGITKAIYIGRGNQYQGLYLSNYFPPAYLRVQDRLLDYVRKFLVGTRLGKMEVDTESMSFLFHFKTEHTDNSFLFGYKERQLFFMKQSLAEIYLSWNGQTLKSKSILDNLDLIKPDRPIVSSRTFTIEDYLNEEKKKASGQPVQKKKEKFLARKIHNISSDIEEVKNWNLISDDLHGEKIDLSVDELKIHGQKFKLHGIQSPWAKRDLIFQKIKKLRKAEEILTNRLHESEKEYEDVQKGDFEFEVTKEKVIQPLWVTNKTKALEMDDEFHIKQFKLRDLSGFVSMDAKSNDHLRTLGSKEHYWFHIENYPGSHALVKTDDFGKLSQEDLSAIASMLRDYSKLQILEIPVLYSQLKNIKGIKGSRGEVILKKPRYLRCPYIPWTEIISIL